MIDPFDGGKPEIWIAREGAEPELLEYDALAADICENGHIHGIVVGDPAAIEAFMATGPRRAELNGILGTEIQRLRELRGSDVMFVGNVAEGLSPESLRFIDQVVADTTFGPVVRALFEQIRSVDAEHKAGSIDGQEAHTIITNLMTDLLGGEVEVRAVTVPTGSPIAAQALQQMLDSGDTSNDFLDDFASTNNLLTLTSNAILDLANTPESWREHIKHITDLSEQAQRDKDAWEEILMEWSRFLVDPKYLSDYLELNEDDAGLTRYRSFLDAALDGVKGVPAADMLHTHPDLIERAIDEYEANHDA